MIVMESIKLKDKIEERNSKQLTNISLGKLYRNLEYKAKIWKEIYDRMKVEERSNRKTTVETTLC